MKEIVVDCKGHLKGRLASVVAKQLLKGQHIALVRCEEANISGSYVHNKIKFLAYLHKTMRTNPARGHKHFRAPSMMIYKAIRGMIPHKTTRGAEALKRLHVYDGCPPRYSRVKKMVIPDALRVLVMKPQSKYIRLGDLASQMGWSYGPLIKKLEKERLRYAKLWYHRKVRAMKKHQQALKAFRYEIPRKPKKKVQKKEEEKKPEEGKAEEGKKEEPKKSIEKKKHHFNKHSRRLHKLAIIQKVNKLEADAKKKSNKLKMRKAAERRAKRRAEEKKAAALKRKEAREKKAAKKALKAKAAAKKPKAEKKDKKPTSEPKKATKTTKVAKVAKAKQPTKKAPKAVKA